jgi:hypothetical protein
MAYFLVFLVLTFTGGLFWDKIPARLRGWLLPLACVLVVVMYYFFRAY